MTPSTEGLTLTGSALNLDPADGNILGGVSATTQTFGGAKTFSLSSTSAVVSGNSVKFTPANDDASHPAIVLDTSAISTSDILSVRVNTFEVFKINVAGSVSIYADMTVGAGGTRAVYASVLDLAGSAGNIKVAYTDSTGTPGDATIAKMSGK